jgi:hypothetical protein
MMIEMRVYLNTQSADWRGEIHKMKQQLISWKCVEDWRTHCDPAEAENVQLLQILPRAQIKWRQVDWLYVKRDLGW